MAQNKHSLLSFPSNFMIKVFGKDSDEFKQAVLTILKNKLPDFDSSSIIFRKSAHNNYLALSINLSIHSKEQLDQIYLELTASPHVVMVL